MILTLLGFVIYFFGAYPDLFGVNHRSLTASFPIYMLLFGLALLCIGGMICFIALWRGKPKSFAYDIGVRLVATGYIISLFSGLADFISLGSHHILPFLGPLQTAGVIVGEAVIGAGFLLILPYKNR
jgi:hypothetical protein